MHATIECGISSIGVLHVAVTRGNGGFEVGNKIWLGLLITLSVSPLWAGIYIGTDATPPQTYQSSANYPANVVVSGNTAAARNCRLYYDGKGPIPPLTCSGAAAPAPVAATTIPKSPAPGMSNTIVPSPNDKVAQQAPLAHVDTTTMVKPPLTRPTTATPVTTPTPVVAPVPPPKPMFTTTAMPGSLKANVERIVAQSHWGTVVWKLPIDYNWNGTMTITAPNVQGALSQLLAQYPVQATFYDKNHIVAIEARRVI